MVTIKERKRQIVEAGTKEQAVQILHPTVIPSGNKNLDVLMQILLEARYSVVVGNNVVVTEALNVAIDMVGDMQSEYLAMEKH